MRKRIEKILTERDGISAKEARIKVLHARRDLYARLEAGEPAMDICQEWFGLEPDYLDDLI